MSEKEKRVYSITSIYYSNPKVQEAILNFSNNREAVPRYFEGFGKRPDSLQYPSDIINLAKKGATSFHVSEEIWNDPLQLSSDISQAEMSKLRKAWDLLIDIDSPYLDYSKIAAKLIIEELEKHGVRNYGIKFSGSKGFHLLIPSIAFPSEVNGQKTSDMFPEWPRAISEYLMYKIRPKYNKEVSKLEINFEALKERTNLSKEDITQMICPNCGSTSKKGLLVSYKCPRCKTQVERKNPKLTNRKLKCINESCSGTLDEINQKEFFFCENCKTTSFDSIPASDNKITFTKAAKKYESSAVFQEEISGEKMASLDLVLVAPRHLFRAPYSLHEKTALASVVITKNQMEEFQPKDADPLKVKILDFYPKAEGNEASELLESALQWKGMQTEKEESDFKKKYSNFEKITVSGVSEEIFPVPIKKLLKGLTEGKKRGLFILLTFLRSLNFSPEYINTKIRDWNKLNDPPLKEGYIKSQIDWHLKQRKQILPPNYSNPNFYKDLKLIDSIPKEKNPVSEVLRKIKRQST